MKIPVVDYEICIGCGSCPEICPEVFELRGDEKAWVIGPEKCDTAIARKQSISVLFRQ